MSTKTDAEKLKTVSLLKVHTHQGKPYAKGADIRVNAADEAWLIAHDIIADTRATPEVAKK
ncbi:MAG TPA: hypothetical protein VJA19_03850 [Pseudomonas sp.]|nr:hypothetical protein [Pseudomonas sp.]